MGFLAGGPVNQCVCVLFLNILTGFRDLSSQGLGFRGAIRQKVSSAGLDLMQMHPAVSSSMKQKENDLSTRSKQAARLVIGVPLLRLLEVYGLP